MRVAADAALIDIEGTVGSIAFVHEVLFPYARKRMDSFVRERCEEDPVRAVLDAAARDAAVDIHDLDAIVRALHEWSDRDVKITPLKELQGMIWQTGFESGEIQAELYADAVEALRRYHAGGVRLFVYSSGSIAAQRLLFGHSTQGDLRPLFDGYFDTTTGPKRAPDSYRSIAGTTGIPVERFVFFSDNAQELDAARAAGMQTVQLARPSDGVSPAGTHPARDSFAGIAVERVKA